MTVETAVPAEGLAAFENESYADFSIPENRAAMERALEEVRAQFGREYELSIGGQRLKTREKLKSLNPSHPAEIAGIHQKATPELALRAVEEAHAFFPEWSRTPAAIRVAMLLRAAAILRARKLEFDAWLVHEAGKTWAEAEADVSEAVDFCEFYAREMLRLAAPPGLHQLPGERDELVYVPLGVGVVIPPWNFPLAILVGMTTAALVTGNTVIMKPSSDTPTIAAKFAEVLREAGFPERSFSFLAGSGSVVGDVLVQHPKTRFVSFTGSKEVGLRINELAAKTQPGQVWIKRVVVEMGGKDAIIVDREADLDAAVTGVLVSAFGYQGQKCSACSRAIVDAAVYDEFLEKLGRKVEAIKVGPAEEPSNYMGPVINERSRQSILRLHRNREARRAADRGWRGGGGRWLLHTAHRDCRCGSRRRHFQRGDLRPRAGGYSREGLRRGARSCQCDRVWAHRRGLHEEPRQDPARGRGVLCRQSLLQPEVHRRDGGRASVRRFQHVRHGFEGRRARLPAPISSRRKPSPRSWAPANNRRPGRRRECGLRAGGCGKTGLTRARRGCGLFRGSRLRRSTRCS